MFRANASPELIEEIKSMILSGPVKAREAYGIVEEGDDLKLSLPKVVVVGRKPD